jgi:hypothetical protein
MNRHLLDDLPGDAQLWIYCFDQEMDASTRDSVVRDLYEFVVGWTSHDEPVRGAFEIVDDRFVMLAGYCEAGLGGCSIDGSVGVIRSFKEKYGLDGFNRDLVFYRRADGAIDTMTRDEFQEAIDAGRIGVKTVVFDATITKIEELRAGRFETTFDKAWHARAFGVR